MIHHIKRATRILVFWSLISVALLLSVIRVFFSEIEIYKTELEAAISVMVDAPCEIGSMRINIYGLTPKLLLNDITLFSDNNSPAIVLQQIQLRLDLSALLLHWDVLAASRVTLIGAKLSVIRKVDGGIAIAGLKASDDQPDWLLNSGQYEMLNSHVTWQDQKRHAAVYQFEGVDIYIDNQLPDQQHRINIAMMLPPSINGNLQLSMLFKGNLFESEQVSGHMYAKGQVGHLASMTTGDLPFNIQLRAGQGEFELWSEWVDSGLTSVAGTIAMQQTEIELKNKHTLILNSAQTSFHWLKQQYGWQISIHDVSLDDTEMHWQQRGLSIARRDDDQQPLGRYAGFFNELDLAGLSHWLQNARLLSATQQKYLQSLNISGNLHDFVWYADLDAEQVAVNGSFSKLSFSAVDERPGADLLTGAIYGDQQRGYVQLASIGSRIDVPSVFGHELVFSSLQGKIHWFENENFWSVATSLLELDALKFKLRLRGLLKIPKNKPHKLFVDLQTAISETKDLRALLVYLPTALMDPADITELDDMILSGELISGSTLFYGHPEDYPFKNGQGVCEVVLQLHDFGLNYHPQWPIVNEMDAKVMLKGDRFQVNVKKANVNGALLHKTVGWIPSLYDSDFIYLKGQVVGSIGQSIGFLQQTPIADKIYPIVQAVSIQGQNVIDLDIKLARNERHQDTVDGVAHLFSTKLSVLGPDIPVTGINGYLFFNEDAVFSKPMVAMALGYPIKMKIDAFADFYTVTASGKTDVEQLRVVANSPLWDRVKGQLTYELRLKVPYDQGGVEHLHFASDLHGLEISLPDAFAKTATETRFLSIDYDFSDTRIRPLKLNYADLFKAAIEIDTEKIDVFSANYLFGDGNAEFLHFPARHLHIVRQSFDLTDWVSVFKADDTTESNNWVDAIKLNTQHLIWNNQDLGLVLVNIKAQNDLWVGDMSSVFTAGQFSIPSSSKKDGKMIFDLQFINLDLLSFSSSSILTQSISPLDFPLFSITSEQLIWQQVNQGELSLASERISQGMVFKPFEIHKSGRRLQLLGSRWWLENGQPETEVVGVLEIKDFGVYLSEMQISQEIRKSPIQVDILANWSGGPHQLSWSGLKATLDVTLGHGRLLGVEPGIGRILGMLDIRQMARRLRLDFSDVYAEGLSYDQIRGSFFISEGLASTSNLQVDALPAIINMTGDVDLINQSYDQIVTVLPKSSAAIPIAGTIVDGVAALVSQTMTGQRKEGLFFGMQFALTGQWQQPEMTPLHHNEGLITKAWLGITDFSWLGINKEVKEREHD